MITVDLPNRIITRDNAEYLLLAESEGSLEEWVMKLKFHAELPPSMQLMSYDNHKVRTVKLGRERGGKMLKFLITYLLLQSLLICWYRMGHKRCNLKDGWHKN